MQGYIKKQIILLVKKDILMKIYYGKRLIANVKVCNNFFSKFRGLMFSRKLKKNEGILLISDKESILETSIHMLFVFFKIDVVWINNDKKIVDIKRNVKPFKLFIGSKEKAKYVLEVANDEIKNLKIGDKLEFKIERFKYT